ncbi:MAG: CBS domain-containing protein [Rubrobacter sp.]|nr:CBS domain-containing protein [Rubrobacter sp.]
MDIRDIMDADMLAVESEATLREATQRMSERGAGAALVGNPGVGARPGIITERDVLESVAAGQDPDRQRVADNSTMDVVTVPLDSSLEQAVDRMLKGSFRHLLVVHGDDIVGIVSMRDLVQALTNR